MFDNLEVWLSEHTVLVFTAIWLAVVVLLWLIYQKLDSVLFHVYRHVSQDSAKHDANRILETLDRHGSALLHQMGSIRDELADQKEERPPAPPY